MPKVTVLNQGGNQVEELELSQQVFACVQKEHLVHDAVVAQLHAKRMGTASTKTRSEVKGGGRKPWRQKGTGRARHGTIRSPIWVGGGITFGPKPKEYKSRLPRKVKKQALRSVLTAKVAAGELVVLDQLRFEAPKTKAMIELLEKLNVKGQKTLILVDCKDDAVYKSARNIPGVKTLPVQAVNIFDLVKYNNVIATKASIAHLEEVLA